MINFNFSYFSDLLIRFLNYDKFGTGFIYLMNKIFNYHLEHSEIKQTIILSTSLIMCNNSDLKLLMERKSHFNSVFEKKFFMIWKINIYCQKECLRFFVWNIISKFDSWNNVWKFLTNLISHQSWIIRKLKIQKQLKITKYKNMFYVLMFVIFIIFGFEIIVKPQKLNGLVRNVNRSEWRKIYLTDITRVHFFRMS